MSKPFFSLPDYNYRRLLVMVHDLIMTMLSMVLVTEFSFFLAKDLEVSRPDYLLFFGISFCAAFVLLKAMGLYRGLWRFASAGDARIVLSASALLCVVYFIQTQVFLLPFKLAFFATLNLFFVLPTSLLLGRIVYRWLVDYRYLKLNHKAKGKSITTLIIGIGDDVDVFLHNVERHMSDLFNPVGIIATNPRYTGSVLRGVPILGDFAEIEAIIERINSSGQMLRKLAVSQSFLRQADARENLENLCKKTNLNWSPVSDFTSTAGSQSLPQQAKIVPEDLLQRSPNIMRSDAIRKMVRGKVCFVTGAGGSIGNELCVQLLEYGAKKLIAYDVSELALFNLEQDLAGRNPYNAKLEMVIGNVRDKERIAALFSEEKPAIVLHAAAMKHIPYCEKNWQEAALTNSIGTKNLAQLCEQHQVEAMVLISTDKAVKPVSVLGATKKLAELYMEAMDQFQASRDKKSRATRFLSVRFGNVLGSSGSVLEKFNRQIMSQQPITVTHPDMVRYFMTVQEAVNLVLHASASALYSQEKEGSIFILDMGEPIRIADMAERLIRMHGLEPGVDVPIVFTGMRHGERLYEEVLDPDEPVIATDVEGVYAAESHALPLDKADEITNRLLELAHSGSREETLTFLQDNVPGYEPQF